ncbi:MAG: zeta toxin family protein [Candidatus Paceibacterota bacterium]|jgi:predicted kinase
MKIIILNGSSCSGKSSVIKILMKNNENLFHLSYDYLKWSFSKYKSDKYYKDVQKIVLAVAKETFSMKYNIISDSSLTREFRQKLIDLAKQENYEVVEINLEADFEVLLKRFNERVESALKVPKEDRKISNLSVDRFKELYEIFNKEKNLKAIAFRTDLESSEDIAEKISRMF